MTGLDKHHKSDVETLVMILDMSSFIMSGAAEEKVTNTYMQWMVLVCKNIV